jgi:hypothetical protein
VENWLPTPPDDGSTKGEEPRTSGDVGVARPESGDASSCVLLPKDVPAGDAWSEACDCAVVGRSLPCEVAAGESPKPDGRRPSKLDCSCRE